MKSIPYKLRGTSTGYYKALILAIFLSAGCNVSVQYDFIDIIMADSDSYYRIFTQFGPSENSQEYFKKLFINVERQSNEKNFFLIGFNVSQPSQRRSGTKIKRDEEPGEASKVTKIEESQKLQTLSTSMAVSGEKAEKSESLGNVSRRELQGYALLLREGKFFYVDKPDIPYNFEQGVSWRITQSPITPKEEKQAKEIPSGVVPKKLNFGMQ